MLVTEITAQSIDEALKKQLEQLNVSVESREVGTVIQVGDGIARVDGLRDAMAGELLEFIGDGRQDRVRSRPEPRQRTRSAPCFSVTSPQSRRTTRSARPAASWRFPPAKAMLGRVVNPLGQPIDGKGPIDAEGSCAPSSSRPPASSSASPSASPLQTGILAIDSMIPIGRGQRELIIGDRQTGKTAIAIDAIINQKGKDVICIYVAIGQKASTVAGVVRDPRAATAPWTTPSSSPPPPPTPLRCSTSRRMAGAAMGEYFIYNGEDGKPASREQGPRTCSSSTTTCPSRPWPTVRCR